MGSLVALCSRFQVARAARSVQIALAHLRRKIRWRLRRRRNRVAFGADGRGQRSCFARTLAVTMGKLRDSLSPPPPPPSFANSPSLPQQLPRSALRTGLDVAQQLQLQLPHKATRLRRRLPFGRADRTRGRCGLALWLRLREEGSTAQMNLNLKLGRQTDSCGGFSCSVQVVALLQYVGKLLALVVAIWLVVVVVVDFGAKKSVLLWWELFLFLLAPGEFCSMGSGGRFSGYTRVQDSPPRPQREFANFRAGFERATPPSKDRRLVGRPDGQ